MVRVASRKIGTKTGTIVSSVSGVSLGGGTVSAGNTSTAANVQGTHTVSPSGSIFTPGPSVNQLSGSGGMHLVGPVSSVSSPASSAASSDIQSTNTEYKLSLASMLLAMKNQALGALSLGGSKTGGSVTENISGINLG